MDDEFIPESKESERIRPRTNESYIGDVGISDQTSDSLESFYTESMMSNYEIEAKTAATEATSPPPTDHITAPELPTTPTKVEDEIKAINTLYEKHDKKAEKVQKIISLKKTFNAGIKSLATMLLEMYKKSLESYTTWRSKNKGYQKVTKRNLYSLTDEFDAIKMKLEEELKTFKKSLDFKYIDGDTDDCDKIIKDFKPQNWRPLLLTPKDTKDLLMKICTLFSMYKKWIGEIDMYAEYFNKWMDMEGGRHWNMKKESEETVVSKFTSNSEHLTGILTELAKDETEIKTMEEQLVEPQPQGINVGGGNKRKNRTRRRAKPVK